MLSGLSVQGNIVVGLARLVAVGEVVIDRFDPRRLLLQLRFQRFAFRCYQIGNEVGVPEGVASPIAARLQTEDFLQNLQIVRNGESVAGIFMAEEGVEIVEARPGDRRHAHGAGFMRGKEDQVFRIRLFAEFVETFQGVNLAVPQRILELIIGFGDHQRQIGLAQNGRSEHLVSQRNTVAREWQNVMFDHVEKAGSQRLLCQDMHPYSVAVRFSTDFSQKQRRNIEF